MKRDLHFKVDHDCVLPNLQDQSSDIHISLDTRQQSFYYNFFASICRQIQLLSALGDGEGAAFLLATTKADLSIIVEKATFTKNHIIFFTPKLDDCARPVQAY